MKYHRRLRTRDGHRFDCPVVHTPFDVLLLCSVPAQKDLGLALIAPHDQEKDSTVLVPSMPLLGNSGEVWVE